MVGFKHTGERLRQLQREGVKRARNIMIEVAERDLGRSLKPEEIKDLARQAEETFGNAPVYGGE